MLLFVLNSGYSCEDHFHEPDTFLHSWEVLLEVMTSHLSQNMLIDVGMPIMHQNVSYNCRVVFYNKKILLIRPKMMVCDDGCYRETRWFSCWTKVSLFFDFTSNSLHSELLWALGSVCVSYDCVGVIK